MIVYKISVNTVNANMKNPIRMGKSALTRIQQRKEFIKMQEANVEKYLIRYVKDKGGL